MAAHANCIFINFKCVLAAIETPACLVRRRTVCDYWTLEISFISSSNVAACISLSHEVRTTCVPLNTRMIPYADTRHIIESTECVRFTTRNNNNNQHQHISMAAIAFHILFVCAIVTISRSQEHTLLSMAVLTATIIAPFSSSLSYNEYDVALRCNSLR